MKLWDKGYTLDRDIESFVTGDDPQMDRYLVEYDCVASMAHAKMLGKIGILKKAEVAKLIGELRKLMDLNRQGKFVIQNEQEDCHTAIEEHLTNQLGVLGKKIHTARSRNDQVLTALRLFYKDALTICKKEIAELQKSMAKFGQKYGRISIPGYTHMRKAMPSSVGLWARAFSDSMKDNITLINSAFWLMDQSPLGTGAGYGVPLDVDRNYTAKLLGFKRIQKNPVYAQNSRGKFELTMLHALSQVMLDVNKMASDLILFSMPEFGFFELPDKFTTGSSMMPHKKNPDVLELLRAKYHEVSSDENLVKSLVSNLPSGYHRDFQVTKEPTIKALSATRQSIRVLSRIFSGLRVNKENCEKAMTAELFATGEVFQLVKEGIPFREAYQKMARKYARKEV